MTKKLLALYGLKWNPFAVELPLEALFVPAKVEPPPGAWGQGERMVG